MEVDEAPTPWCRLENCDNIDRGLTPALFGAVSSVSPFPTSSPFPAPSNNNDSCSVPFCVNALSYAFKDSSVRPMDLALLVCNMAFLVFLLVKLVATVRKLHGSLPLFKILYVMVFMNPIISIIHLVISMSLGYHAIASKVTLVILRGVILMTELSVVTFGLLFKLYRNHTYKLAATVVVIVIISVAFTIAEGMLEFKLENNLACKDKFKFFTHGGMLWLFSTSIVFACVYAVTFLTYLFGLHKRWDLPSKKSFYRYALFLSLVNVVQAVGSMLWYKGKHKVDLGHAGICLTLITTVIYVATFAPVVYWIFLSNYFRMNQPTTIKDDDRIAMNTDTSVSQKRNRVSRSQPVLSRKRSFFEEHAAMLAGSLSSSVSSYGSLMDEEEFVRQQ